MKKYSHVCILFVVCLALFACLGCSGSDSSSSEPQRIADSQTTTTYTGQYFSIDYPDNWEIKVDEDGAMNSTLFDANGDMVCCVFEDELPTFEGAASMHQEAFTSSENNKASRIESDNVNGRPAIRAIYDDGNQPYYEHVQVLGDAAAVEFLFNENDDLDDQEALDRINAILSSIEVS